MTGKTSERLSELLLAADQERERLVAGARECLVLALASDDADHIADARAEYMVAVTIGDRAYELAKDYALDEMATADSVAVAEIETWKSDRPVRLEAVPDGSETRTDPGHDGGAA